MGSGTHAHGDFFNVRYRVDQASLESDCDQKGNRQKKIMKYAEYSEQHWQSAWEFGPFGMAIVSLDGRFEDVNRKFSGELEYTTQEMINQHVDTVTAPEFQKIGMEELERVKRGELAYFEQKKAYITRQGKMLQAFVRSFPVMDIENADSIHHFLSIIVWQANGTEYVAKINYLESVYEALKQDHTELKNEYKTLVTTIIDSNRTELNVNTQPHIQGNNNQVAGNENNSTAAIRWLVVAVVVLILAVLGAAAVIFQSSRQPDSTAPATAPEDPQASKLQDTVETLGMVAVSGILIFSITSRHR